MVLTPFTLASDSSNSCHIFAQAWFNSQGSGEAQSQNLARTACKGGSQASEITTCLQNARNWLTPPSQRLALKMAALACQNATSPAKVQDRLNHAWSLSQSVLPESKKDEQRFFSVLYASCDLGAKCESVEMNTRIQILAAQARAIIREVEQECRDVILPEVLAIPIGGAIPLSIFDNHDSCSIGRSIVERLKIVRDGPLQSKPAYYDFWKDSDIQLVFHEQNAESILEKGFLNSRQIKNGRALHTSLNLEGDFAAMTFPASESVFETLPKYAYLGLIRNHPQIWQTRLDPLYGNVVAVFKNHVKKRTTFTAGNSAIIPTQTHTLSFETTTPFPEPDYSHYARDNSSWGHHFEAQIWGRLLPSDVEYFLVNCPYQGQPISPDNLARLLNSGTPVYECINDPQNSKIIRGQLIPKN